MITGNDSRWNISKSCFAFRLHFIILTIMLKKKIITGVKFTFRTLWQKLSTGKHLQIFSFLRPKSLKMVCLNISHTTTFLLFITSLDLSKSGMATSLWLRKICGCLVITLNYFVVWDRWKQLQGPTADPEAEAWWTSGCNHKATALVACLSKYSVSLNQTLV